MNARSMLRCSLETPRRIRRAWSVPSPSITVKPSAIAEAPSLPVTPVADSLAVTRKKVITVYAVNSENAPKSRHEDDLHIRANAPSHIGPIYYSRVALGRVAMYDDSRRFGFISPLLSDDGGHIFFHKSTISEQLRKGDLVVYYLDRPTRARRVQRIHEELNEELRFYREYPDVRMLDSSALKLLFFPCRSTTGSNESLQVGDPDDK